MRGLDQQRHLVQQKINQLELKFKEGTKREAHVMRELPVTANTVTVRGSSNFKGKGSIVRGNNPSSRCKYEPQPTVRERERVMNLSSTMPIQQPESSKEDEVKALKEVDMVGSR